MNAETLIAEVVAARQTHAELKEMLAKAREQFEQANAELIASLSAASVAVDDSEEALREWGKAEFTATGSKKPAPGVGIRVSKKPAYDLKAATDWAIANAPALITPTLNRKAFEALVKEQPLDFVTEEESVTVTLASDMG